MDHKKIRVLGAVLVLTLWAVLTAFAWFSPPEALSVSERRPLKQMPELSQLLELDRDFMEDFESYTLDQFPLRDQFRQVKSLFHYYGLRQKDNNGIYLAGGAAAKLEYPLREQSVLRACTVFNRIHDTYLADSGSRIFMSVAPDKGFYLGPENGYPVMDYDAMFRILQDNLPWATYVDITDCLDSGSYYRTDTHWKQPDLLPAAKKLADAMGVSVPAADKLLQETVEKPFYGVYYGQAALPMEPETIDYLTSDLLESCTVYNYETEKTTSVYDMEKLDSRDLYDIFLSGSQSLLRIENPDAETDRELIVFRDSFGSSLVPLLVQDYKTVTLVDIRYLNSNLLGNYLDFSGQDVLFLYSTLVLNNSETLK